MYAVILVKGSGVCCILVKGSGVCCILVKGSGECCILVKGSGILYLGIRLRVNCISYVAQTTFMRDTVGTETIKCKAFLNRRNVFRI